MNVDTEYKVSLTQTELQRIIAAHCDFPLDSKIEITIQSDKQESVDDWIDVPFDWNSPCCPAGYSDNTRIDVKFYDGEVINNIDTCYVGKLCWIQEGKDCTIVKYRISKESI